MGCHRDYIFGVVTAVLSWQNFKLKQKGMLTANISHIDDIEMKLIVNVSTCSCQLLVIPFSFGLLTKEPLPLLPSPCLPPKTLTASSSSQIPATVQWRGFISDNNCMLEWMYICTYVSQRYNTVLYQIL